MSEYVGGQPQQTDGGAAVQSLDLRTANLTQELAQLLAQTTGGKPTPSAAATGSQFNTLQALVSTATQTQRGHQPGFRDGLSALSYARPAPQVAPPPPAPAPVLTPPEPSLIAAPGIGFDTPAPGFASAPSFSSAPSFAPAPSFPPAPSFSPASSFAAPVSAAFMAPMAPATNGLLVSDPHDDEPMPIPSTWRQPTTGDDDKWYRQQLGAAGLGLLAGLVVVVPAVLWLSGFLGGGSQAKSARSAGQEVATMKVKLASAGTVEPIAVPAPKVTVPADPPPQPPQRSASLEPPSSVVTMVAPAPRPVEVPKSVEPPRSRADELVVQAKRRIEEAKDVPGARDILQQAPETATSGAMTFLLAETYDPNMLASWQTRGVMANPERARALYQRARELGDSRAQQRLDWLMAN
jgi:hypothetical protein